MSELRGARILVVEDEHTTADLVALYLRHAGHDVSVVHSGSNALRTLRERAFDLVVLDVMLPGVSGLELCRHVRQQGTAGIILLTARTSENDRIAGLDLGADDYVSKPFSPRELVARVQAVLRRRPPESSALLVRGSIRIDRGQRSVTVNGEPVILTPSEFALLETLAVRPGHVRSRAELLDALPQERDSSLERTVDVHVRNLRKKIERDPSQPQFIQTVLGSGYRFVVP